MEKARNSFPPTIKGRVAVETRRPFSFILGSASFADMKRANPLKGSTMIKRIFLTFVLAASLASPALAQTRYGSGNADNSQVPAYVPVQCDTNKQNCQPTGNTNPLPTTAIGSASLATGQASVTTSSTLVAAARTGRQEITLSATSSVAYYVGVTGVTSSTGVYVAAGGTITIKTAAAVYAVGASAVTISYIELY